MTTRMAAAGIAAIMACSAASAQGLREYWSFDTGFTSSSLSATAGTPIGDGVSITTAAGEFIRGSGAMRIDHGDGTNADYLDIVVPVFPTTAPESFTVAVWYRFDPTLGPNDPRHFVFETTPNFSVGAGIGDADDMEWFFAGGPSDTAGPNVNDGQWHHLVLVFDKANTGFAAFFHDGQFDGFANIASTIFDQAGQAGGLHIGNHRAGDGSRNFQGYIDDFAIFDGALSLEQVQALFTGTSNGTPITPENVQSQVGGNFADTPGLPQQGPVAPALVEYWSFDSDLTGAGTQASAGTAVGDGVTITSTPGEFVRGSGALKIDHGDGTNADYVDVTVPALPNVLTQIFTFATWYRLDPTLGVNDGRNFIFETSPNFSVGAGVGDADDTEWFFNGGPSDSTGPSVNDGQWHHIAIVMDLELDLVAYYHDGVLRDLVPVSPSFTFDLLGQLGGLHIGNHRTGDGTRNFQGYIDDFAIWTEALGQTQVRALVDGQFNGQTVTPLNLLATVPGTLADVLDQEPTPVESGWTLAREIPFTGPSGLDYDDATGILYAGRRFIGDDSSALNNRDGLYSIDGSNTVTQLAGGNNVADVEISPSGNAVFWSEDFGGVVYRTDVGSTGRTPWAAGFAPGDDDPTGITFVPQGWTGNAFLSPGDGLIQDRGNGNLEEIYVFSPDVADLEVGIDSSGGIDFNEIYFLDANSNDGDLITPFDPSVNNPFSNPGAIAATTQVLYLADEGSPNAFGAIFRVTGPDQAERLDLASAGTIRPVAIAVDPAVTDQDSILVYDLVPLSSRILRLNVTTGETTVVFQDILGGGTATASVFGTNILWSAMTMSADGSRLFFCDEFRRVIYEYVRNDCPVDLTGDGVANIFDIFEFFNQFGAGNLQVADFTNDGALNIFDIFAFFNLFGAGC